MQFRPNLRTGTERQQPHCFAAVTQRQHKQLIDQVGSNLLELPYANEVIRKHLHEWLRFSRHLEERGLLLPATGTETVRQYVAQRTLGTSASRARVLRASVRIFLETDE